MMLGDEEVLQEVHDDVMGGHLGVSKTVRKLKDRWFARLKRRCEAKNVWLCYGQRKNAHVLQCWLLIRKDRHRRRGFISALSVLVVTNTFSNPEHYITWMIKRMNRTINRHLANAVSDHQRNWKFPHGLPFIHMYTNQQARRQPVQLIRVEIRLPCYLKFSFRSGEHVTGENHKSKLCWKLNKIHKRIRRNI